MIIKEIEGRKQELNVLAIRFKHAVSELDILRWLYNFKVEDRDKALQILHAVEYFNEADIMTAFHEGLLTILQQDKGPVIVLPIGEFGKSGTAMVYYLKKTEAYRRYSSRIKIIQASTQIKDIVSPKSIIVLLDDFFGSGGSVHEFYKNDLSKQLRDQTYKKLVLLAAVAQIDALDYIKSKLPICTIIAHVERDKAFSNKSSPFGYRQKWLHLREFCYTSGKGLCVINNIDYPLGYRNSQALVSFSYGSPNNALPILWSNKNGWYPLFPRSSEPKMARAKSFRKEVAYLLSIARSIGVDHIDEFLSGHAKTNHREYKYVTRDDFLRFCIIKLKNMKRPDYIICQLLGLHQTEYETVLNQLDNQGVLNKMNNYKLTDFGTIMYYQMVKKLEGYKMKSSEIGDLKKQPSLYMPKTFRGIR